MTYKQGNNEIILRVENLSKHYLTKRGMIKPVDNISFNLNKGETFGCAGESGCGKSTLALTILRLIKPTEGKVFFEDSDIYSLKRREMSLLRKKLQVIFQDPYSSLPPGWSVRNIIMEPLRIFGIGNREDKDVIVNEILDAVGLKKLTKIDTYPDQLSGGERDRISLAITLALAKLNSCPLLLLDECMASLDANLKEASLKCLRHTLCGTKTIVVINHEGTEGHYDNVVVLNK